MLTDAHLSLSTQFANKWVFSYYDFKFVFALTWVHTVSVVGVCARERTAISCVC